jgi:hypothetical protein
MHGMNFTGTGECTNIAPNCWLTSQNNGAIDSRVTFTFRSKEHKTRVTLTIDYQVPIPLLGQFAENEIVNVNDKEAELILDNLRKRFETA